MLSALLMGEVYRMTYNELFDLKKSLLETGQTELANILPVKTYPPLEAGAAGFDCYISGEN